MKTLISSRTTTDYSVVLAKPFWGTRQFFYAAGLNTIDGTASP